MKQKETLVKTLRTTQDFTELLSLSELSTQMEVLSFLQGNLFDYQMNYFKSHLLTFDELLAFIPDKDKKVYFKDHLDGDYVGDKWVPHEFDEKKVRQEFKKSYYNSRDYIKEHLFLVNTKFKKFYHFNKKILPKFHFFSKDGLLIPTYVRKRTVIRNEQFGLAYSYTQTRTIKAFFDMKTNLLVQYSDSTEYTDKAEAGWHQKGDHMYKDYDD